MDEDMLADQRRLVSLLGEEGWDVTDVELSAYDSPWEDSSEPEATITITARKLYDDSKNEDDDSDGDDENPYRVS